jgi:6-phosphogluconolactonase
MTQARQFCRWHYRPDSNALEKTVAAEILRAATQALRKRGAFHVVLAGGTTPRRIYEALRASRQQWASWHVWFGDERCLPPDDAGRNSRMAMDAWLALVSIPPAQIHPIAAELGAEAAAADYARQLEVVDQFDLVLLGLGEDGHTASLFPGHDWGVADDAPAVLAVADAPKPPPQRVSLSARRLAAAREVIFVVSGAGKQPALDAWQAGAAIPAAAIAPAGGVDIYVA